jgi:FtsH-binding integral membrane protein
LFAAIVAFAVLEAVLLSTPIAERLTILMLGSAGGYSWLIVMGLFMGVSHVADRWAHSATSLGTQYMGLSLYVVAQALITLPLLFIALSRGPVNVIPSAAITTGCVFTGLSAMGLIVCSILFGFSLGIFFTVAMIGLASGYILMSTSRVLHEYHIGQHVAASLSLFAAVALLFWYILQFFMSRD